MVTNYKNIPCVIKFKANFYKVEKPNKFFNKHREMENDNVEFHYIDENITGMQEIAKALQKLEDSLKGIIREEKPQQEGLRSYPYQYRINRNTVLMAYTEEDLNKLKKSWNVI